MNALPHTTVMLHESVTYLGLTPGDIVIDCTVGGGGHTELLANKVGPSGRVIGLDRDVSALEIARSRLDSASLLPRVELVHAAFSEVGKVIKERGLHGQIRGILADIGVSSMHLDTGVRGFSFQSEGPLDMRMDSSQKLTAADLLNSESEEELSRIFRDYGEEPKARQLARKIVSTRVETPFSSTLQLANFVKNNLHYPTHSRKHPATRVFQALRIAVNDELGELRQLLQDGLDALCPGGRLAIISFHSLEDRIVKETFVDFSGKNKAKAIPKGLPIDADRMALLTNAKAQIIKPFPISPSQEEIMHNPRARSAKLRVLQKI
jgi:16S rRNA (cytosine1402-N4)-methyltransferase